MLNTTIDGTVTGFGLANPSPAPSWSCHKGLSGADDDAFFTGLDLLPLRPAYRNERRTWPLPGWLRQRIEAIIFTLKHQLGLEQHLARGRTALWARILQRLLALNTVIWHKWTIGAPIKRSLIAYDH